MREQTFEYNGVTLTVHSATIESALLRDLLLASLSGDDAGQGLLIWYYAKLASQTTIEGDLGGWTPPAWGASEADVKANYAAFRDLDEGPLRQWIRTLDAVDAPEPEPLDEEKKG